MRARLTRALLLTSLLLCSCKGQLTEGRDRAIEQSLQPYSEIKIATGSRVNLSPEGLAVLEKLQAAGLVRLEEATQGHWDEFASKTHMEGAKSYKVVATQRLTDLALNRQSGTSSPADLPTDRIADLLPSNVLEDNWDYYLSENIFLGLNCFGNSTTFGRRHPNKPCAFALAGEDYPVYSALAGKGLITLTEVTPPTLDPVLAARSRVERAAEIALTPEGARVSAADKKKNSTRFVFAKYRVQTVGENTPVDPDGAYRAVSGTHALEVVSEFADVWTDGGKNIPTRRRFRAVLNYDAASTSWKVVAVDVSSPGSNFESANVPPILQELRKRSGKGATNDTYEWRIPLGDLKMGEVLRDDEYTGPLATPGEKFRLVLAKIRHVAPAGKPAPAELLKMLPGRLRCVTKYSDFKKEWTVVALDVGPADSEEWYSKNVQ